MEQTMNNKIVDFIEEHHVLTLATSKDNIPYCANCFYTYSPKYNALIFSSDLKTKHIQDVLQNNTVAGSIVLETKTIGKIQGIQLQGVLRQAINDVEKKEINKKYLKRFPYAILKETELWLLELSFIKMTDNRLGFGKKLLWKKQ
jgi:uncharacterized protein YhbP (UPF0306 family)